MTEIEDKFDIDKQLARRRKQAITRILLGYFIVVLFIFGALQAFLLFRDFFRDNPIYFVILIAGVLTLNIVILFLFIIKPSDRSLISLDLMNFLNQKLDAGMRIHIIRVEQSREEMECMDSSGKYPRMFMMTVQRPIRPLIYDILKVPVYYSKPTGRLDLKIKFRDQFTDSRSIKKAGGLKRFSSRRGDFPKHDFWSREYSHDKNRNFLVGSVYFGYRKGNETIPDLSEHTDDMLRGLKKIEAGK